MKCFEVYGLANKAEALLESKFYAGVECEIEGVKNPDTGPLFGFVVETDGSLRSKHGPGGHGYEFKSPPLTADELKLAFSNLHGHLQFYKDEDPFSPRTSTHVHVNCLGLETSHARNLLLLYALFEEVFFSLVKPERRSNIHCVPLTETHMPGLYSRAFEVMAKNWHKYTAVNLTRMKDLGTIEFRHLHGTNNSAEFNEWLMILSQLWSLSQTVQITKETLCSPETLLNWFDWIFHGSQKAQAIRGVLPSLYENTLIDVKFSVA